MTRKRRYFSSINSLWFPKLKFSSSISCTFFVHWEQFRGREVKVIFFKLIPSFRKTRTIACHCNTASIYEPQNFIFAIVEGRVNFISITKTIATKTTKALYTQQASPQQQKLN